MFRGLRRFREQYGGVIMSKFAAGRVGAATARSAAGARADEVTALVCGALVLALLALAIRIAVSW